MTILDIPMAQNDADAATIGDYLRSLLGALWHKKEKFSGKRPFGNGGWEFDLYRALVEAKVIKGTLDRFGCVEDCDWDAGDKLISDAIEGFGKAMQDSPEEVP